jgi:hypothetical protein
MEKNLIGLNLIHSVGVESVFADAIMNEQQIQLGVTPDFLLSVASSIKEDGAGDQKFNAFRLAVGVETCKDHMVLDSGGFTIYQGTRHSLDLPRKRIIDIYHRYTSALCFGADCPFPNLSDAEAFGANDRRTLLFHRDFHKPPGTLFYEPLHGAVILNGEFTLVQRQQWAKMVEKNAASCCDGWAMRLGIEQGPAAEAYFALWPWSYGIQNLHILGTADIALLCLFAYLDHLKVYKRLSLDATNSGSSVTRFAQIYRFKDQCPSGMSIGRSAKPEDVVRQFSECQSFSGGPCEVCVFMQAKFGKSFVQLFLDHRKFNNRRSSDRKEVLQLQIKEWAITHSIYVLDRFIAELKVLVRDRDGFFAFLERIKKGKLIKTIEDVIDPVVQGGREAFESQIALLGKPEPKKKAGSRP